MIKIVHCVTDEKFAKNIVTTFDFLCDRCQSTYVYIKNGSHKQLTYIADNKSIEHLEIDSLMERLHRGEYDVLFLHNLRSMPLTYISRIPLNVRVVWLAWGFDIYSCVGTKPLVPVANAIHPETQKLLRQTWREKLNHFLKMFYKATQSGHLKAAVTRADYFSGVLSEEYEMMCQVPYFRAQQIDYRYASPLSNITLEMLANVPPVKGNDILVGNSADPTNNHADIFKLLSEVDLKDRKVVVPLSYAGTSKYKARVKALGEQLWGSRFVAIDGFLPYTEYKTLISSCGFRIFGHERQQAMGNVNMAFRDGCKVFLSETSIVYKHQCKLGLRAYSIQHDILNGEILKESDNDEIYSNRKIAIENSLTEKQIGRLYGLVEILNGNGSVLKRT